VRQLGLLIKRIENKPNSPAKATIALLLAAAILSGGCLAQKNDECTRNGCTIKGNGKNTVQGINNATAQKVRDSDFAAKKSHDELLQEKVAPLKGAVLPVKWENALVKAVQAGVIDLNRYKRSLNRGGAELTPGHEKLFLEGSDENIPFTHENAYFNLNMLWPLGLVNENPILTKGQIYDALLAANSYWPTQTYAGIAQYLEGNGKDFSGIDAKKLLGHDYSSQKG